MTEPRRQTFHHHMLVLRAQTGDREALEELLVLHQDELYRYVRSLIGDRTLAQDVLQEVFLLIWRNLGHLREPKVFRSWAFRIASRRAFRVVRKESKWIGLSLEESGVEPISPAEDTQIYDQRLVLALPSLLAAVSPASRAVLSLHYLEEMSLQETADVLGIPLGTAKSRLGYGLASIRRLMNKNPITAPRDKEISE